MAGPDAEEARFPRSPPPRDPKNHDQGSAGADIGQKAGEHGPAGIGAGGMPFKDSGAAGGAQFVQLRIGALFVGGDTRGTDQAACDGLLRVLAASRRFRFLTGRFYNSSEWQAAATRPESWSAGQVCTADPRQPCRLGWAFLVFRDHPVLLGNRAAGLWIRPASRGPRIQQLQRPRAR
jgi:hypothetical protein